MKTILFLFKWSAILAGAYTITLILVGGFSLFIGAVWSFSTHWGILLDTMRLFGWLAALLIFTYTLMWIIRNTFYVEKEKTRPRITGKKAKKALRKIGMKC